MTAPPPAPPRQSPLAIYVRRVRAWVLDELLAQILEWPGTSRVIKSAIRAGRDQHPWEHGADKATSALSLEAARRYETDEASRRKGLEEKARGNLLAITLAFSILFAGLAFFTGQSTSTAVQQPWRNIGIGTLVFGMAFLLSGGFFALVALQVGEVFLMTPEEESGRSEADQAQLLLWCTKQNQRGAQLKVNALDISFKCIRNGVVLIAALSALLAFTARAQAPAPQPHACPPREHAVHAVEPAPNASLAPGRDSTSPHHAERLQSAAPLPRASSPAAGDTAHMKRH